MVEVDGPVAHRIDQRTALPDTPPNPLGYFTTLIVPSLVGAPLATVHVNGELGTG